MIEHDKGKGLARGEDAGLDVSLLRADIDGAAIVPGEATSIAGMISERDVVAQLAIGADPDTVTADRAMSRNVISAQPTDPVLDVVFLMLDAGVRHIPVIDDDLDQALGVVSMRDLLQPLLVEHFGGTPAGARDGGSDA